MERREFFKMAAAAGLAGATQARAATDGGLPSQPVIERSVSGLPHRGKVLAVVTPHLDDGPIFAGGTLAKLLSEGYTGYFIRTSNDEKDSYNLTLGETVLGNERDAVSFVRTAGLKKWFDLSYRNHSMDDVSRTELRGRLMFLFRLLKVDTVISYDPWGHYEENPDHYVTAQAVEAASWMAGDHLDLPEHFEAGLKAHSVKEKYYFARGPQLVNRVVDTSSFLSQKIASVKCCKTMLANMVRGVNESLEQRSLRLPAFSGDPDEAAEAFIRAAFVPRDKVTGAKYGLEHAEEFHYIGPDSSLDEYISQHAIKL